MMPAIGRRVPSLAGSFAPSCMAATGGMRVARRAGAKDATAVTMMPTAADTMIVRGLTTSSVLGRSMPRATNAADSPLARK